MKHCWKIIPFFVVGLCAVNAADKKPPPPNPLSDLPGFANYERVRKAVGRLNSAGRVSRIEWAKDGEDGHICLLQARPETVKSRSVGLIEKYVLRDRGPVLAEGRSVWAADRSRRRANRLAAGRDEANPGGRRACGRHDRSELVVGTWMYLAGRGLPAEKAS